MKRTKLTAVQALGQKNISSFFTSENHLKDVSSSRKSFAVNSGSGAAQPGVKAGNAAAIKQDSPLKKSFLRNLENLPPSSPELVLSVPETPQSQIRLEAPLSCKDPGQEGRKSMEAGLLERLGQLSPICRIPRSKDVRRMVMEGGQKPKRELESSSSVKRLLSPPQESNSVKKSRSDVESAPLGSSREVTRPVKMFHLSNGQSDGIARGAGVVSHGDKGQTSICRRDVDLETGFTGIVEQRFREEEACGSPAALHTANSTCKPSADAPTRGVHRGGQQDQTDPNKAQTGTASNQKPSGDAEAPPVCPEDEMLDESWFTEQMDDHMQSAAAAKPKKPCKVPDHVILCGGANNRYWVLDVEERAAAKTLTITCSRSLHPTETCLLRDGWVSTPVRRGDVVHLEGRPDAGSWLVDREQGFLVLLPDSLVSGTSISSSIRCMRRAVLGDMFKSFNGGSKQMLNGTMVHEVFQKAAMAKDFSLERLSKLADQVLCSPQHLGLMYGLGVTQEEMKQELHEYLPSLEHWAKEYLSTSTPKAISLKVKNNSRTSGACPDSPSQVTVTELVDIEENVWSPRFGLKGKIDLTARIRIHKPTHRGHRDLEEKTVPLELKTGRESNSIEHRSQVILYTLMSSERYHSDSGLLLYLKTGSLHPVVAGHMDRRELLKLRNTLVHHVQRCVRKEAERSRLSPLPDILTDRQTCRYCPQSFNCALYERSLDGGAADVPEDVVRDFLEQQTGHLTPPHLSYFSHWLLLCCLEASTMESKSGRKRVWLQTAEESEKSGTCLGNVRLDGPVLQQSEGLFLHRFQRSAAPKGLEGGGGLSSGERIVVSDQQGHMVAMATGHLSEVSRTWVSCTLDRDLSKFRDVLFRLDGDEGAVGLSTHLCNLSRLMENGPNSDRLRELVVDLRPPQFISNLSSVLPRDAKDTVANILRGLNKPQKQAMKKVLLSQDYTLIVGMPGTGKTTTICTLVRILHACGFSVLLTSYTHSAVDNILLKLKRFQVGFLRLGQGQKVHPDILPYTEESVRKKRVQTLSQLEQLYSRELVVATTCMGIKHPIFTHRRFDFCIVDEASQISQPICLGPLFFAKRFVLVGDHQQLPPIVQNQEARSLGMDESLFKRLELHRDAVVQLNVQYRMNSQIMSLSNSLMYEGQLECGSERTATGLLSLPLLQSVQSALRSNSVTDPQQDLAWIQDTLLPGNPVCFLDCSKVPALESVEQGGISNPTEAAIIHKLLSLLIKAGCKPSDIGVIAPYRQQLKCISATLQSPAFTGVEVNTVDRYQGRDKSLIVLSFVRSTAEDGSLGELLKDWRRLNVAITRAKHKLLMVGSAATLRRYEPVDKLLKHLRQENMVIQLPPAAHLTLPSMSL